MAVVELWRIELERLIEPALQQHVRRTGECGESEQGVLVEDRHAVVINERSPLDIQGLLFTIHHPPSTAMYVAREIMYCKPGKVRALVEKFVAMSKLSEKVGMPPMRIMTDFAGEHYWTLVTEMEVESLQSCEQMMSNPTGSAQDMKKFEEIMKGYHDLVDHGKREIYKIELG